MRQDVGVTLTSTLLAAVALVVALGGITAYVLLRKRARELEARVEDLRAELSTISDAPPAQPVPSIGARRLITIEILNPIELASQKARAAGLVGSWRPDMITKIVYDAAAKQIASEMVSQGVVAEVQVHVAAE